MLTRRKSRKLIDGKVQEKGMTDKRKKRENTCDAQSFHTPVDASIIKINEVLREKSNVFGYENQIKHLMNVISKTVENGESNSVLICGGRGCGKTTIIKYCLAQIKLTKHTYVINLNGFVHANDVFTIRQIAQQLDIDANDITEIVKSLKKMCGIFKNRIIIILDEFDMFCRRNQTLLYNLFDVSQQCQSICIIGMTCRLDCIELLEKRVKSRINQRIIHLITPFNNFNDYYSYARNLLKDAHIKIDNSLKEKLTIEYSMNKSMRELKRALIEYAVSKSIDVPNHNDSKLMTVLSLSTYELCILILALKYTQNYHQTSFNCAVISESLRTVPSLTNISKNILFKLIHNLIEAGLIVINKVWHKNQYLITEWTSLSLNVDECHIKDALNKNEHLIPLNIKQIFKN